MFNNTAVDNVCPVLAQIWGLFRQRPFHIMAVELVSPRQRRCAFFAVEFRTFLKIMFGRNSPRSNIVTHFFFCHLLLLLRLRLVDCCKSSFIFLIRSSLYFPTPLFFSFLFKVILACSINIILALSIVTAIYIFFIFFSLFSCSLSLRLSFPLSLSLILSVFVSFSLSHCLSDRLPPSRFLILSFLSIPLLHAYP